jgi:large subunit ribosomal protein L10
MPNPRKIDKVEKLTSELSGATSVVLGDFTGINVAEISELRRRCRKAGVSFRVVKNTLATRAVTGTGLEPITEHLTGPTGLAFSADLMAPAKVLKEFNKEFGKLEIKLGFVDGQVVGAAGVHALADLPGREQLISMALAGLQAPITGLVRTLNATIAGLVIALDQIAKQKAEAA